MPTPVGHGVWPAGRASAGTTEAVVHRPVHNTGGEPPGEAGPHPETPPLTGRITPGQIARWADVIADGRDGFPPDLPGPDRDALAAAVRERLRARLVGFIARAIAGRRRQ